MDMIHKIAAVVIKDNKFLMVRKKGKDIFTSLGGRLERGESEEKCLLREIKEELNCNAQIIKKLGDFFDQAIFDDAKVKLSVYLTQLIGEPKVVDSEIQEYKFLDKNYKAQGVKVPASIEKQILPFFIKVGLLQW